MTNTAAPHAIVFDLDGTLIHSAPDIHAAVNRMLATAGQPPLDLATVTRFIGNGVPKLVERVIAHLGLEPGQHGELAAQMLVEYKIRPADLTRPYPGVVDCLEALKADGVCLGICTNKPHAPAVQILEALGLMDLFGVVIGGDSLPVKKPDPAPLIAAFDALGGRPALYVGDSEVDAETAGRAGLPFALFTEGYRKSPIEEMPHDIAFSSFEKVLPVFRERLQPV